MKEARVGYHLLFDCPYCEVRVEVDLWGFHRGGACVSDTESDQRLANVKGSYRHKAGDDGAGTTRSSKPSALAPSGQGDRYKRKSVVMAATSESEEEITSKKHRRYRWDSGRQPTKRPRLSSPSPPPKNPKVQLPVEVIELSSDEDTAVFKPAGEHERPHVPERIMGICSEEDTDVDELEGDEEDKAEEASVEGLVHG
jgi:hypothetical protein